MPQHFHHLHRRPRPALRTFTAARACRGWPGLLWLVSSLAALTVGSAAQAQYKVIGPDKSVTYTDRPVAGAQPLRSGVVAAASASGAALPYALAQVVSRYPVTLYAMADCAPCGAARQALRQRGVPHKEVVVRNEDLPELLRREGVREVPVLRIGAQQLVGWQPDEYQRYLDAAGYPRESVLPTGYAWSAAQPLVPPAREAGRAAAPAQPPATPASPPPPQGAASGFRF